MLTVGFPIGVLRRLAAGGEASRPPPLCLRGGGRGRHSPVNETGGPNEGAARLDARRSQRTKVLLFPSIWLRWVFAFILLDDRESIEADSPRTRSIGRIKLLSEPSQQILDFGCIHMQSSCLYARTKQDAGFAERRDGSCGTLSCHDGDVPVDLIGAQTKRPQRIATGAIVPACHWRYQFLHRLSTTISRQNDAGQFARRCSRSNLRTPSSRS